MSFELNRNEMITSRCITSSYGFCIVHMLFKIMRNPRCEGHATCRLARDVMILLDLEVKL